MQRYHPHDARSDARVNRLLLATAIVAFAVSAADAGSYSPPPVTNGAPAAIAAACRIAGDAATPRPEHATLRGHILFIDGGDRRSFMLDSTTGVATLHCVNAWFRARWERERF
ncbi:MAG: hypothetical protein JWO85_569 [Candidatus Eremiobacteraeota bacterium]|nr:hypothetical protein [Candidatus Eremiobacteraeota bacterium]